MRIFCWPGYEFSSSRGARAACCCSTGRPRGHGACRNDGLVLSGLLAHSQQRCAHQPGHFSQRRLGCGIVQESLLLRDQGQPFFEDRPGWGAGFDFTHDKVYARTGEVVHVDGTWNGAPVNEDATMNQCVQSFSMSHGVNILALNGYHRWMLQTSSAFLRGRWQPYTGAGLSYYLLHPENAVNSQKNSEILQGGGYGYQLLGGLQYGLAPSVGVFIEAKYNCGKVEVETAGGGRGATELKSSKLLAGMSVAF